MPPRRRQHHIAKFQNPDPITLLWALRMLVPLGGHRQFICPHGFGSFPLAHTLGLSHFFGMLDDRFDQQKAQSTLFLLHRKAEKESAHASPLPCLKGNVARLSDLVGLSPTDCRILEFSVTIHNDRLLDEISEWLGNLSSIKMFHALSLILDLPEPDIRESLSTQGILARSGLVCIDRGNVISLRAKLDLLSEGFADLMVSSEADPIHLLRGTVSAAGPGQLSLADYPHISCSLEILHPYLHHAKANNRRGVNIFIHGAPGTGKSQLSRALADDIGCDLFEVSSEDAEGDPVDGERRLRAYRAAQSFFEKQQTMLVFDEAEDIFNDGNMFLGRKSTAQVRKAWINRMLEDNPVPTIWLSNSIAGIDPAFIRRFDMVIELPVPTRSHRAAILHNSCSDLLDKQSISRIAEAESLAPAVVVKAASVIRSIRDQLGQNRASAAFERLIGSALEAQGHRRLVAHDPHRLPNIYDPAFIHANADLAGIATGLATAGAGRLCLYGPPGTGKTAYGRWLAQYLGVPLVVKRASDLMSKFLGDNEKNIAKAFREAEQKGALLLIDEVDSFLQDRRGAQRGWEVSMVNEMLTQMESFAGVFIASTNLMEGLDQAALRRFDLKVKFDFMRPEQAWELLRRHCAELGLQAPQPQLQSTMKGLSQLTPGDFAAVLRQHRFRPIETPDMLVSALEAECDVKEGKKASIGFH